MADGTGSVIRKLNALYRLLANADMHGLAPSEIAKALGVSASWVSVNLPLIEQSGFASRVAGTPRWRAGVGLAQIGISVLQQLDKAERELRERRHNYTRTP